jgi:UPF0716 protein FxsA
VLRTLLFLFLVVPALELYLLVQLGQRVGVLPVLALLLSAAVLGGVLARAEGLRVLRTFQAALAEGRVPQEAVASGLLVLLGTALLVVPGVLTDLVGVLLFVPFTRRLCARLLVSRMQHAIDNGTLHVMHTQASSYGAPRAHRAAREIIDVEGEVLQPRAAAPALRDDHGDGR